MFSWIFGGAAIGLWVVATLLYLRPYIVRRYKAWRGQRAKKQGG